MQVRHHLRNFSILIFHHYFLFADKNCIFANKDNNRHKIITKKGLSIIDYSNIDLGIPDSLPHY